MVMDDRLFRRAVALLEMMLAGVLAWVVSGSLIFFFAPSLEPDRNATASSDQQTFDYTPLQMQPIFGNVAPVEKVAEAPRPVVASRLNIRLLGTIVAGERSAAIVLINGGSAQQMFTIGSQMQPGVLLEAVEADAIVVDNHGRKERIQLPQESAQGLDVRRGRANSAPVMPEARSDTVGEAVQTAPDRVTRPVSRRGLDAQLENMPQLLTQARVLPHFRDGEASGYMIRDIVSGSLYEKIGLKDGDIIQSVNGKMVASPEEAMELFNTLKNESSIVVEVERQGSMQQLHYDIK